MSSMRYDAPLYAGKLVYGTTDVGILGSVIRATTADVGNGAGLLWNDWNSSADDNLKFRCHVISKPANLYVEEDGSLVWATPVNGSYSVEYEGFVSNVSYGTTVTTVVVSAPASGQSAVTLGAVAGAALGVVVSGVVGVSALTLGQVAGAASGAVSGNPNIAGAGALTLGAVLASATGVVLSGISGSGAVVLGAVGAQGVGAVAVSGQAAAVLGQLVGQAEGVAVTLEGIIGVSDVVLGAITQVMAGGTGSFKPARSRMFLISADGRLDFIGE